MASDFDRQLAERQAAIDSLAAAAKIASDQERQSAAQEAQRLEEKVVRTKAAMTRITHNVIDPLFVQVQKRLKGGSGDLYYHKVNDCAELAGRLWASDPIPGGEVALRVSVVPDGEELTLQVVVEQWEGSRETRRAGRMLYKSQPYRFAPSAPEEPLTEWLESRLVDAYDATYRATSEL